MESEENAQWQANPLDHCPGIKPEEFKLEKHQKLYKSTHKKRIPEPYLNGAVFNFLNFKGVNNPHGDIAQ